jgi:hypothetical protein
MGRPRRARSLAELHRVAARVEARMAQLQVQRRALLAELRVLDAEIRAATGRAKPGRKPRR